MSTVTRVTSGGQTGVDQAALHAAAWAGIPTGGYAPRGWLTEAGPAPWLAGFVLVEHASPAYPPRTRANIDAAHATLILAEEATLTGGTKLTYAHAARRAGAASGPGLLAVDFREWDVAEVVNWLRRCLASGSTLRGTPAFVLNVAGPRESKHPGIGSRAEAFLREVFQRVA